MNSLLASKLLTDDEKRRMLAAVFPRTMELVKAPDAAAPDLLEALERCLNFIENTESEMGETLPCGDYARAAIACAKGGDT